MRAAIVLRPRRGQRNGFTCAHLILLGALYCQVRHPISRDASNMAPALLTRIFTMAAPPRFDSALVTGRILIRVDGRNC